MTLFCRIYLRTDQSRSELAERLAKIFGGEIRGHSIGSKIFELDVRGNDAAIAPGVATDDFVQWPIALEFEPAVGAPRETYVSLIGAVLEQLWSEGIDSVASCDFEDELPKRGA